MAVDNIYQLTIFGTLQGQNVENVLHYKVVADADDNAFCTGLFNFAEAGIMGAAVALQSIDFVWQGSRAQKIWPLPAFMPQERLLAQAGSLAGHSLPAEVALVITKQSILAGRAYRGRLYLTGLERDSVTVATGLYDAGTIVDANVFGATLRQSVTSDPVGGTLFPVIYHRADHTTTDITNCVARNVPRMQRRRQIGRGV